MTLDETISEVMKVWAHATRNAVRRAECRAVRDALDAAGNEGIDAAATALGVDRAKVVDLIRAHRLQPKWKEKK